MTASTKKLEALSMLARGGRAEAQPQEPTAAPVAKTTGSARAPSREGKLHISAWLSPDYKISLRAIQMKFPERHFQDLFSEALNDLFAKYNVPTVRRD